MANTSQPSSGLVNTASPGPGPLNLHVQPQLPVLPVVYQGPFAAGTHYMIDPITPRNSSLLPLSGHLPAFGPLYHPPNQTALVPFHGDFIPGRAMPNFGRPESRRQNAMRVNRSPYYNGAGHHNHVDVTRIREGTDVRTTVR